MRTQAKSRRARSGVGTGTTSLLMIFTVLCFATLAMLSLSTAASNDRIQERGLSGSRALAEARGAAAVEVASLDETLLQLQEGAELIRSDTTYMDRALAAAQERGWETDAAANTITMRNTVNEDSVLVTKLTLLEPGETARYEVMSQTTELVNGWAPEQDGQLWQPTQ